MVMMSRATDTSQRFLMLNDFGHRDHVQLSVGDFIVDVHHVVSVHGLGVGRHGASQDQGQEKGLHRFKEIRN